ncbi:MAG: site-specific DNA-methyltransferase [Planctomycetia bacterium]|nr:site-specific DNA-methyltransferase [Planctomycetia bacterium]
MAKQKRPVLKPVKKKLSRPKLAKAAEYRHKEEALARPDVGTQPQFRKKAPPKTYRYDSSLAPSLEWDAGNPVREEGEALLRQLQEAATLDEAKSVAAKLAALGKPFLNWAGKPERTSFDVPTLPLFIHERLSTRAILETLKGHRADRQLGLFDLFADPQRPIHEQVLRAYEYKDDWVNRMILGDSLVAMNSLLHYESLGGQVQMIYMDPPYGVKFGSNFQPFVRKRDVTHNDDEDMTREPEMVQAYRDTWELGLHSYLTYLRDRLLLSRELLAPTGSIFVQISDENLHHVRELLDEVFGAENFVSQISFQTTSGFETSTIATLGDFLLWYARDKGRVKVRKLFAPQPVILGEGNAKWVLLPDGSYRGVTAAERRGEIPLPKDARLYIPDNIQGQGAASTDQTFIFDGKPYRPGSTSHWKASFPKGMEVLAKAGRLHAAKESLRYRRYADDFPYTERGNIWTDTLTGNFTDEKIYVVQTNTKVAERCLLLATDPGDLVVDPTCGSGTTAYVAEQWGRRWITMDTSRVPLALARQRLLTATFPWYGLKDETRGPAGGFIYKRRQNSKGDEVGGIVPHITLGSIANNEPPKEEVLVDRPEELKGVTRVTGPFVFEATIPTAMGLDAEPASKKEAPDQTANAEATIVDRMLEILRHSPVVQIGGGATVTFRNLRRPAKTLSLSAEAVVDPSGKGKSVRLDEAVQAADEANRVSLPFSGKPVALVFGPENGAIAERLVWEAAREATAKNYSHLYVIGFAIQPPARQLIENCEQAVGIPATYVQATPDLMMGDLLKNMRSSQILSVCGLPEIAVRGTKAPAHETSKEKRGGLWFEVELLGLDVFDPATMQVMHKKGDDVPAWLLDTDYNGLSFHVSQAFFPRTQAWDNLKRALKGEYEDSVWAHLAGNVSVPFEAGTHKQIAVKVIDDRGNELMVTQDLRDTK